MISSMLMTASNISKQLDTIEKLARINEEEVVTVKEILPLLSFLYLIVIEDWQNYTAIEKTVFLFIWSPLLWFLSTLLMEV